MSRELKDRVYIVTGGSKGFGLAIARSLVEQGGRVGLVARNQDSLDAAVAELGVDNAFGVVGSVDDPELIKRAFSQIKAHFGRLDGLVNNAGLARPNSIENLKAEEVSLQVQTNFLGVLFCCQAAIPLLRGGESPRIVNISSASAHHYDEMCHLSVYAASKAAVERFTRDLAKECQLDEIGVTCIRPGHAETSFAEGWDMDAIMELCDARGIPVVEDAAHSLGTTWNGRKIGTIGDVGCFSFQSYKMINAGEGGIMITDDPDLVAQAVIMSGAYEHNWKKHKGPRGENSPELEQAFARWQNKLPLYNLRMSNLSAAVIRPQIPELARRVRDGLTPTEAEIESFVAGLVDGSIPDYQAAALLMTP